MDSALIVLVCALIAYVAVPYLYRVIKDSERFKEMWSKK